MSYCQDARNSGQRVLRAAGDAGKVRNETIVVEIIYRRHEEVPTRSESSSCFCMDLQDILIDGRRKMLRVGYKRRGENDGKRGGLERNAFFCARVLLSGDNDFFIERFSKMSKPIFQMSVSVETSSIDLLGHVNNREYIRWMEEAATKHAASCGWTFETLRDASLAWVVRQHWVEYLKPALLGDDLNVCTWVQNMRRISSLRRYAVLRGTDLLVIGATEWVLVDYQKRRPIAIPQDMQLSFPLMMPDAQELQQLGIRRMVRFAPSPGLV